MSKHTPAFERCIEQVMAKGHDKSSAFAICTASFQKAGKPILNKNLGQLVVESLDKGGKNSGFKNHAGRLGQRGGSVARNGGALATGVRAAISSKPKRGADVLARSPWQYRWQKTPHSFNKSSVEQSLRAAGFKVTPRSISTPERIASMYMGLGEKDRTKAASTLSPEDRQALDTEINKLKAHSKNFVVVRGDGVKTLQALTDRSDKYIVDADLEEVFDDWIRKTKSQRFITNEEVANKRDYLIDSVPVKRVDRNTLEITGSLEDVVDAFNANMYIEARGR